MAWFHSLLWPSNRPLHVCSRFAGSAGEWMHSGRLHALTAVNGATGDIAVHASFGTMGFSTSTPRSGTAGWYCRSCFSSLSCLCSVLYIGS